MKQGNAADIIGIVLALAGSVWLAGLLHVPFVFDAHPGRLVLLGLFIRFCLQNNGRLSAQKRLDHFDFLSDEEVTRMEQAVQTAYES